MVRDLADRRDKYLGAVVYLTIMKGNGFIGTMVRCRIKREKRVLGVENILVWDSTKLGVTWKEESKVNGIIGYLVDVQDVMSWRPGVSYKNILTKQDVTPNQYCLSNWWDYWGNETIKKASTHVGSLSLKMNVVKCEREFGKSQCAGYYRYYGDILNNGIKPEDLISDDTNTKGAKGNIGSKINNIGPKGNIGDKIGNIGAKENISGSDATNSVGNNRSIIIIGNGLNTTNNEENAISKNINTKNNEENILSNLSNTTGTEKSTIDNSKKLNLEGAKKTIIKRSTKQKSKSQKIKR
jgi:hypothetical protein